MNIADVKPGTFFHSFGGDYEMIRQTGEIVERGNRNQWGRSEPGTHKEIKCVVRHYRGPYRGWTRPHYATFYLFQTVIPFEGECNVSTCVWAKFRKETAV